MFDQLVESEPEGAEFKNRRSFFMVSSVVVGILFLSAVVVSIYADDIGLGRDSFELVEMLAPVNTATEPEAAPPRQASPNTSSSRSALPTRIENLARTDEPIAPGSISTTPNTNPSRPIGDYTISTVNSDPGPAAGSGRSEGTPTAPAGNGLIASNNTQPSEAVPPPPVKKDPPEVKKPVTRSMGVLNGRAIELPKPVYSSAAKLVHASGAVNVQVMIDESGRVTSANAVSGNPLLRGAAEAAARQARFTPTRLSDVPIKVTGVIVYNFVL